jgi:hypothetical protein
MRDRPNTLEIDRLILDGMDVPPGQAERLRILVAAELERILAEEGTLEELAGSAVRRLRVPLSVFGPYDDRRMARGLARSVARAVGSVKEE